MRHPTREQLERLNRAYVAERLAGAQVAQAQYQHTEAMTELARAIGAVLYGDLDQDQGVQTTAGTVDGEEPPGSRADSRAAPVRCCPGSSPAAPGTPHP